MRAFQGGVNKPNVTQRHSPLVWECMLGTVYASNGTTVEYFDYDYEAAHRFAGVAACADLRLCRAKRTYSIDGHLLCKGRSALWGIRSRTTDAAVPASKN